MAVTPERLAQLLGKPERVSIVHYGQIDISILVRRFEKVGNEEEQRAAQEALKTHNLVNPVAGGQPYWGAWRLVSVQDGKQRRPEDTQGVYQTLAKGEFTLDPDGRIVQENCDERISRTFYIDVATVASIPEPSAGVSVIQSPPTYNREFATWTYYIETRYAKYREMRNLPTRVAPDELVYEHQQHNVVGQTPAPMSDVPGHHVEQEWVYHPDCSKNITTRDHYGRPEESPSYEMAADSARYTTKRTVEDAPGETPQAARGAIYKIDTTPSQFYNKWTVTRDAVYAAALGPVTVVDGGTLEYRHTLAAINLHNPISPGRAPRGMLYRAESSFNRFGYYDGRSDVHYEAPHHLAFHADKTLLVNRAVYSYENWPDIVPTPAAIGFNMYQADWSTTPSGYYNGRLSYRDVHTGPNHGDLGEVRFLAQRSGQRSVYAYDYTDWPIAVTAPDIDVQGTVYRANNSLGDQGYQSRLDIEVTRPRVNEFAAFSNAHDDIRHYEYHNYRNKPDAPPSKPGEVWTADITSNEDFTYSGNATRLYLAEVEVRYRAENSLTMRRDVYEYDARRETIEAPSRARMYIYGADSTFDRRSSTYRGRVTAEYGMHAAFSTYIRRGYKEWEHRTLAINAPALPGMAANTSDAAVEMRLDAKLNNYELYDYQHDISVEERPVPEVGLSYDTFSRDTWTVPTYTSAGRLANMSTYRWKHTHIIKAHATLEEAVAELQTGNVANQPREGTDYTRLGRWYVTTRVVSVAVSA